MSITGQNIGENILVVPAANPAVDQDLLNEHLELTHNADDNLIRGVGGYLPAATEQVEKMACMSMITQTRRHILSSDHIDCLYDGTVRLSFGPIQSVTSVNYLDIAEAEQTLDVEAYRLSTQQSAIYLKTASLPATADGPDVLWIDYVAGFGDTAADVPSVWQNIIMTLAFHLYDNRGGGIDHKFWRMLDFRIKAAGGSERL